jgi:demethylmenaquinone methyltransferase/2-methoxy-6-polyprenyl-1,4-benzoquinol methylase
LQAVFKFNTDVSSLRNRAEGMSTSAQPPRRAEQAEEMRRSFGYLDVGEAEKQDMVNAVFERVAKRYDLMNDLMSGGMHRLWKDALVARLAPPRHGNRPWHVIDVAGGTGDIGFRIAEASRGTAQVDVVDINAEMLEVGRDRAARERYGACLRFSQGNGEALPFEDGVFDAYTIAFGIRNIPRIDRALHEAFRVLNYGGQFLCLEFSAVDSFGLDRLYEFWSMRAIPALGRAVAGDEKSYRYLVESIRRFPDQQRFADLVREAGFARVGYRNLSGGIAALHWGWKL